MASKSRKPASVPSGSSNGGKGTTFGDVAVELGEGGEVRRVLAPGAPPLTTQQGVPIPDDQNSLRAGERGPDLLEDFVLREKIFHFDHERIPERVVHARGFGAKGFFTTYESASDLTRADLFQKAAQQTEVFVRFSTVAGSEGSPDLARDVRGFAVKFYTAEGNWDLVGNNIPVFFIQDAMKFPDLIHAAKPEPDRGFPQAATAHDNFWDFISLMPESMHMVMWIMSDRTIPRSFRFMEGFGVHTFRLVDAEGTSRYVKFHWKPLLGVQSVLWDEAVKLNGADADFHRRDLWTAIELGTFPEWELGVQVFDDAFADAFEFDVLDATKLIPEELVPVRPLGRMTLNANVENFFAETEQVAFCTQNVVPGIDFTNDPLLQGRNFSYLDTQLKRLGSPNFTHLPVNAPRCPFANFQQDGHMAMTNPGGRVNFEPNSAGIGPVPGPRGYVSFTEPTTGDKRRVRPERFADHYSQARQFYRSQLPVEQEHIASALVFELSKVERVAIRERIVGHLRTIDETLAASVAEGIGLGGLPDPVPAAVPPRELDPSPALSILAHPLPSFEGRTIGVLVTDGADAKTLRSLRRAADAEGVRISIVAPSVGGINDSDGTALAVDHAVVGGPSVLFDAVALVPAAAGVADLVASPAAVAFVRDADQHRKVVAWRADATPLLEAVDIPALDGERGYVELDGSNATATAFMAACRAGRCWERASVARARS